MALADHFIWTHFEINVIHVVEIDHVSKYVIKPAGMPLWIHLVNSFVDVSLSSFDALGSIASLTRLVSRHHAPKRTCLTHSKSRDMIG